ncbi:MAG: hypothetical protein N4J56_003629 [Chroococcidiopsis sp. SAG 2025]|nr:hypothetical protein [Chroococcidiopsis sp. SAG 2025]MDV2993975.1 hypothetical protein [Chroococcidiopsis sp. SAG 2025]
MKSEVKSQELVGAGLAEFSINDKDFLTKPARAKVKMRFLQMTNDK